MTKLALLAVLLAAQSAQQNPNASAPPSGTPPMSLAERAAAARKAAAERRRATQGKDASEPPELTPEQRGTIHGTEYVNEFLHFRIDLSGEWEALSSERMNRDIEVARRYVNSNTGASPYRVLWIGDSRGRNAMLSVVPAPPDSPADPDQVLPRFKEVSRTQLAQVNDLDETAEPVVLGDPRHKFAAFRFRYLVQGQPIVQSGQVTKLNGFWMTVTITGSSDQDVTQALQSLKSRLAWTEPRP